MGIENIVLKLPHTELSQIILDPYKKTSKEIMLWRFRKSSKTFLSLLEDIYSNPLSWSTFKDGGSDGLSKINGSISPITMQSFWVGGLTSGKVSYCSSLNELLNQHENKILIHLHILINRFERTEELCYTQRNIEVSSCQELTHE